ncbi:ShlB/FhaC/HecB family hemolysin secretion/activation protein [Dyella flava]|uniref:ShlB/FhaC/HecB family hemolysin secretion/activation protein n=1 Tax=Dyella flava TaxID=1920170 RepID=A0ABS2K9U1_9GAMM|nr:ShlB/FhaC/HecB family hemolysin secretion/activation protein [Dyella flava]MBM7127889.1 ShlB/FhaC/HecB family hemolysin secretion/activation protein [Dyella flava]
MDDRYVHRCRPSRWRWLPLAGLAALAPAAFAQDRPQTLDELQQRERTQRQAQERQLRDKGPDVRLQQEVSSNFHNLALPEEAGCVELSRIHLVGERATHFWFVQRYLSQYAGRCVGHEGISLIVRRAGDMIIDRGYVTTRIGLGQQDLSKGVLTITLMPGVIHAIRMADGASSNDWRWALPMRPGDLLNLRDVEQGLDQMQRLPSQDVKIDIAPAEGAGQSDLVISIQRSKPWHVVATLDDSGAAATGLYQAGLNIGIDNPLHANDLLSLGVTHDVLNGSGRGTQGFNGNYAIPRGNWLFSASVYGFRYHQTVEGSAQAFMSSGISKSLDLSAQRLLHRNHYSKTTAELHVGKRWAHSYIEDVELDSQRRDMTMVEAAILHRRYLGNAQLDLRLAERFGVPWFGGQHDPVDHQPGDPSFRYHLTTMDASLTQPFILGGQPAQWTSEFHGQYTDNHLYGSEYISIGGRYTVRGFDGEQTLAAAKGWYWRNTLSMPLGKWPLVFYAGLDTGRVSGPGTEYIPGNTALSGGFFGLRGSYRQLSWDAFIGKAVHGGRLLPTTRPASGFQLVYAF